MKILIMVLSYNEPPYSDLMKMQQQTFGSENVDNVYTIYYHGRRIRGGNLHFFTRYGSLHSNWERLEFDCTDAYYYMAEKFQLALKYAFDNLDFDIIFRTNSSSYVNQKRLVEFAYTLPKTRLYGGWELEGNAGYNVVSGAGIWLSPDTAKIVMDDINVLREREEDNLIAEILNNHRVKIIDDKSRIDVPSYFESDAIPLTSYHYRFKTGDRQQDVKNMNKIHQLIWQNEPTV